MLLVDMCAGLDDHDNSLQLLEKALRERDGNRWQYDQNSEAFLRTAKVEEGRSWGRKGHSSQMYKRFAICKFVEKMHMVHIAISLDKQKVCTLLILSFLSLLLVRRKIAKDFSVAHILFYFFFALEHLYIFLYQPQWLIFQYKNTAYLWLYISPGPT